MKIIDDRPDIWPFLLISLVIHAVFVFFLYMTVTAPRFEEQIVEVIPLFDDAGKNKYRIADIDEPDVQQKPDKPKFLGRYSSRVPEEQVATGRVASGGKGKRGSGKESDKGKQAKKKQAAKKPKKDLFAFDKRIFDKGDEKGLDKNNSSGSPSGDFFPDFKRGDRTYLNVLRYPDVDYFVRMKRAFRVTFNPVPSLTGHFAFNRVAHGNVEVVLGVTVDSSGSLAEAFIFKSSGIPSYDDEALRTVRASAPFSSPPAKFLEDDGVLRMSWTFTVIL